MSHYPLPTGMMNRWKWRIWDKGTDAAMRKIATYTIVIFIFLAFGYTGAQTADFDHSDFDRILQTFVDHIGLVDYRGIAEGRLFKNYITALETADIKTLSGDARLAFWINAYNAVTIDKVIRWKPKKSVRETFIPGIWTSKKFFKTREHTVAGQRLSLDNIEHDILRKQFKEPRIHFAVICASRSCPPLPRFAYTEENVQTALEEETRKYINSNRGIRIDTAGNRLHISRIFEWFPDDFTAQSSSVIGFLERHLEREGLDYLKGEPEIMYLPYDWALNAQDPLR